MWCMVVWIFYHRFYNTYDIEQMLQTFKTALETFI